MIYFNLIRVATEVEVHLKCIVLLCSCIIPHCYQTRRLADQKFIVAIFRLARLFKIYKRGMYSRLNVYRCTVYIK